MSVERLMFSASGARRKKRYGKTLPNVIMHRIINNTGRVFRLVFFYINWHTRACEYQTIRNYPLNYAKCNGRIAYTPTADVIAARLHTLNSLIINVT